MIKTIIKRDGSTEDFSAEKLNGWGIWASKNLGTNQIDWADIVLTAVSTLPEKISSTQLQNALIDACLIKKTWLYSRMAGRLYAAKLTKDLYNSDTYPHIKDLHKEMYEADILAGKFYNDFTEEDYEDINSFIDHKRDLEYAHFQIDRIVNKYTLQNRKTKKLYETPQFAYMRVAMRLAQNKPRRLLHIKSFYDLMSRGILNVPTPYFTNAGTTKDSYNSCCVYRTRDNLGSLNAGDNIAYMMSASSAGIGGYIESRSLKDEVRGGIIEHQGKLPYYRAVTAAVKSNLQNGRSGAITITYSCYDPEVAVIQKLKNPITPKERQIRDADYSMAFNSLFVQKAARNEDIALFSVKDAPEIYENLAADNFAEIYEKAIKEKRYHSITNARDVLASALTASVDSGRHYYVNLSEINRHTPFKDSIWQSNLCQEIAIPTHAYNSVTELYMTDAQLDEYYANNPHDSIGEVGMCSLSGIDVAKIKSEEEYAKAAYYALLMIHTAIHESEYVLPQIGYTAKARNSAGVSMVGLAYYMAKNKLSYKTQEGKNAIYQLAERHYWHLANASLELSKEFGVAKWIDKTKWVDGWTPLDTYNKNIDQHITVKPQYDWADLSRRIVENGGIHNSVLTVAVPSESSSVASGTTNGVYPIRRLSIRKENDNEIQYFTAPESEKLGKYYDIAFDVPTADMKIVYGLIQAWTDQAISADDFKRVIGDEKLESAELLTDFFNSVKYGNKSRYYIVQETSKEIGLGDETEVTIEATDDCESCKL